MKMNDTKLPLCLLLTALLLACSDKPEKDGKQSTKNQSTGSPSKSVGAPPVSVTSVEAIQRDFEIQLRGTGTVIPVTSVEVRPQINSVVKQVHFEEGQFVKKGALLFSLDSRTDEANVNKATAQLAKDEAALQEANRQLLRNQQLLGKNFISQGSVDTAQSQVDSQAAAVSASKAALMVARVSHSYAQIRSPLSGRVGAVNVSAGSTVEANKTPLATITQMDPINIGFNLPQRNLNFALAGLKAGGAQISAKLPEGNISFKGRLSFVDSAVDQTSGTLKAKGTFPNEKQLLWPGSFVDVALVADTIKAAIVIPQNAVIESARGSIVYVIEGGKAKIKPVKVLALQSDQVAVSGIAMGDKVVIDGRSNLRPGAVVVERADAPQVNKSTFGPKPDQKSDKANSSKKDNKTQGSS